MKIFLQFLFIYSLWGVEADDSDDFRKDNYDKFDLVYGGVIDKDNEADILRPCSLDDLNCMRKFLASNSNCKPKYGPEPDPLVFPLDKFYIPIANLTITHTDLEIKGFKDAKITEFYVNKETGNLVISINVQKLTQSSPRTYFTFQRTGKEAIIRADFTTVTYDSATFVAAIPKVPHLQLDRAEIHADIPNAVPVYAIGPRIFNSTDPDVVTALAVFVANIPIVIQEAFVFQSHPLTTIFIQKFLCDFGLPSYENYITYIGLKGFTQLPGLSRLNTINLSNNIVNKGDILYSNKGGKF